MSGPRMTVLDDECDVKDRYCTVHKSYEKPEWFGLCWRKATSLIGEIEHPVEHNEMKGRVWAHERKGA